VASFRATLEEVTEADLLIHVVDLSHPNMDEQVAAVEEVLEELNAGDKTVITALNKLDSLDMSDPDTAERVEQASSDYPNAVVISALTGQGMDDLRNKIEEVLRNQMAPIDVLIPYARGELVAMAHEHGSVEKEEHTETGTHLIARLPLELTGRYVNYWYKKELTND
jgi:GTP-binding protein HflX